MRLKFLPIFSILMLAGKICLAVDTSLPIAPTNVQSANTRAEQMKILKKETDDAETAYLNSLDNTNRDELWDHFCKIADANLPQIFELAKQKPQSESALDMFEWILMNRRVRIHTLYTNGLESIELLRDYHALNPRIAKICKNLGNNWDPTLQPAIDFLHKAADQNPNPEVRGQAILALARFAKEKASALVDWESDTNSTNPWYAKHKAFIAEGERNGGSQAALLEAQQWLHLIMEKYSNLPTLQPTNAFRLKKTLGELAELELFDLNLVVGKKAPEIEGEDIAGQRLKLSDYRGKIVMLSFWASWCGPCMQMVPSEVKLAARLKDKPFALIGINGDSNRNDAKHAAEKENMSWPSFWDKDGSTGPIPTTWNVRGWPTVYVLDANGVIRFNGENIDRLNQKIDSLLSELASKSHN